MKDFDRDIFRKRFVSLAEKTQMSGTKQRLTSKAKARKGERFSPLKEYEAALAREHGEKYARALATRGVLPGWSI